MAKKQVKSSKSKAKSQVKPKKLARKKAAKKKLPAKKSSGSAASAPVAPSSAFVWHELMTTDVSSCKRFYSQMFGWSAEDTEMMPGFIYTLFKHSGKDVGGMMAITPEMGDTKPHWMLYVGVRDVDKVAERCESLGGEICVPAHDIPVGRFAILRDPSGAGIAIFKPKM